MGNVSIDLTLTNIWRCWYLFRKGKKRSFEIEQFSYYLERGLYQLWRNLNNGNYRHGSYRTFIVRDTKRRDISVACIRDRILHRLLYEYLTQIYDTTFIYDAWSCRKGKGLIGAIKRTQIFLNKYPSSFVWRADVKKFFDHVDQDMLTCILKRKIKDPRALLLLQKIIDSFAVPARERERERVTALRAVFL